MRRKLDGAVRAMDSDSSAVEERLEDLCDNHTPTLKRTHVPVGPNRPLVLRKCDTIAKSLNLFVSHGTSTVTVHVLPLIVDRCHYLHLQQSI